MLADVLNRECISIDAELADKESVLVEIASMSSRALAKSNVTKDEILNGLKERELICSTGFGNGLAIPHCRLPSLEEFLIGVITTKEPVEFDSQDGKPVRLIFFLLGPEEGKREHLHLLSELAQMCREDGAIDKFVSVKTADNLLSLILDSREEKAIPAPQARLDLIHVFVQNDEDLFLSILEVVTAFETSLLTVLDSQDVTPILGQLPLYMGLIAGKRSRFSRIIVLGIKHNLTNEVIRRVEQQCGPLNKQDDVFLTVQPLYFAGGCWLD